jgi:hypothetical protein
VEVPPGRVPGAAWKPICELVANGNYPPLFVVRADKKMTTYSIFYLAPEDQRPDIFERRNPLSPTARRAGWEGFGYNFASVRERFVRLR